MIGEHQRLFGEGALRSCGTDKGYYSAANRKYLRALPGLEEEGLQQPGLDFTTLSESERATRRRLANRRAGIEPLLGYAKQGGQLGRSRMKADETTLAAGYAAIGGLQSAPTQPPPAGQEDQTDDLTESGEPTRGRD